MARPTRFISVVVIVAMIISAYLAWQLRLERRSLAQLQERALAPGLSRPDPTSPAAAEPSSQQGSLPAVASSGAVAEIVPPAPGSAMPLPRMVVVNADGTADSSPTTSARAYIQMFFGDVETALNLSPEEMEALVKLIARGVTATPEELDAATGGKYHLLEDRARLGIANNRVYNLRSSLSQGLQPITDTQAERLQTDILEAHRRIDGAMSSHSRPSELRAMLEYDELRGSATDASYAAAVESARSYLTPQQIAVWQSQIQASANSSRRDRELRRLRMEAGATYKPEPPQTIYSYPGGIPTGPPRQGPGTGIDQ